MTTIAAALEAIRPELADRYAAQVRRLFDNMVERHGPTLKGIYNCWTFARSYSQLVSPVLDSVENKIYGDKFINEERLAIRAAKYAEIASQEWLKKIEAKLGELENAEVTSHAGARFTIKGERAGHSIVIEQDIIVKSSTKGLLFNQFPARIYVDGKFTSEAKYKKAFA